MIFAIDPGSEKTGTACLLYTSPEDIRTVFDGLSYPEDKVQELIHLASAKKESENE